MTWTTFKWTGVIASVALVISQKALADPFLHGVQQLSAGSTHTCAVMADSTVECWGDNSSFQLGNAVLGDSPFPLPVRALDAQSPPLRDIVAVGAGDSFTCALQNGGSVFCWGDNTFGNLGDGSGMISAMPTKVRLSTRARAIAVGRSHACALLEN